MDYLNLLRWKRIKEAEMLYIDIKEIVKNTFNYEVRENSLDEFIKNIRSYSNIDEGFLLSLIEENVYKKLKIFYMKDLKKYKEHPIKEYLTNPIFKNLFKQKNRINTRENEYYVGDLDSCYRVVKYNEYKNIFEIKLACVKSCIEIETQEDGEQNEVPIDVYDSVKYIIDIEKKLIFMFYNDILDGNFKKKTELSNRKIAFCKLFDNVSHSNIINYEIIINLQEYFNEYLNEIESNDIKKSISVIESLNELGEANALKSIASDFKHSKHRIEAIKYAINNENHIIATLECVVNSKSIKLRHTGDIFLQDCTFQPEVMESVCNEFFKGYNPTK